MAKKAKKKASVKRSKIRVITNQEYFPCLLSLLNRAKKKVDLMAFSFAIGSASGKHTVKGQTYQVASKLRELKDKRGDELEVRFFTEGLRETVHRNKVTADFLAEKGVEVRYGPTHAKGLCVDDRIVLFGSTNLTNQSLTKNNEANLLINDKKLALEFERYFDHLWNGGQHGEITLDPPFLADGDFKDALIEMIDTAKKTLDFSIYFFNHREIENALIRAHKRGVRVRGFVHQHNSFALSYIWANRSTVKRLRSSGIEEITMSVPTTFSHAKFLVADKKELLLGTGNWLVEDVLIHPQISIRLKDPVASRELIKFLEWEIKNQSV